ncbi:hypothetical protein D3C83_121630 [compost metagenome]
MSVAQNTKSTRSAIFWTSLAFSTTRLDALAGTSPPMDQRPFTASAYFLPAELGLAATSVTSNEG